MLVDAYIQAICEDLARVAAVGDESTARAAGLLLVALESSLARRLQEALAEAALELSGQIEGNVELRVAGGDLELVHVKGAESAPAEAAEEALDARITLRLPESLKARLEAVAGAGGVSVNTWLVRALTRELQRRPSTGGSYRLTGYGRS